jgi:hypothetical protein
LLFTQYDFDVQWILMTTSGMSQSNQNPLAKAGGTDFDFLFGTWRVHHRKLKHRLAGATDWIEFEGEVVCRPVLGGLGNVDDNLLADPSGAYLAMTLRCYDFQVGRWSIWWVDARTMQLGPPVHGQFEDGIGTFCGDDTFAGKPIRVRFLWSDITPDSARWEQAFSDDGGANWEPNWVMIFKRQDPKK